MRRTALLLAAALLSTPVFAMHCPQEMAKIDALLKSDPPADTEVLAEVPVLVVSAAADQDLLAEARARGAQACLLKPVDLQQLRQMALSLLGEVV